MISWKQALKHIFHLALAVLACWALFALPLQPGGIPRPRTAIGISLDAVVLAGVVLAARLLPPRARLDTRRFTWLGSGWAVLGGACWALLVTFEMGRAATLHATNNDLPLYDSILLAHHLYVLMHDLYGWWATAGLVALLLTPLLLWATATVAFGRLEAAMKGLHWGIVLLGCAAVAITGAISDREDYSTRFITLVALDNAERSFSLWEEFQKELDRGPGPEILAAQFAQRPDVEFYIVESYGEITQSNPEMNAKWEPAMRSFDERILNAGFHVASGLCDAPVHGGRSWIADASLLMGVHVAHEATYEHLMTLTDTLPQLPRFFAERGYTTLLVKPKDRARPGVSLENPFGFQKTVFAHDLDYKGPYYGWGEIPDQFSIDRVEEEVIGPMDTPVFAWFHLVTSHMPWAAAPPIRERWQDWQGETGARNAVFQERNLTDELRMRFSRWKRILRSDQPERELTSEQPGWYVDNILYDLEAAVEQVERGDERPRLIIVMGDHQPPLVAPESGPEVIVHVLATDERWLEAFRAQGFADGMIPVPPARMAHRDFFSVLVRALE